MQGNRLAEQFAAAAGRHDGPTACAQLSPSLRKQLVRDESDRTCAKAVLEPKLHGSRIASARVYATSAQVQLAGGDTMFLSDSKLGWPIEAVGCRPDGLGPLACEAQS